MNDTGRSAIISTCGLYRHRLDRFVGGTGPVIAYFGVNPSTADHRIDDHTVRKWTGFTKKLGGSRFIVGNLFDYRATEVEDLKRVSDPSGGLDHDRYIRQIIEEADILMPCWGNRGKLPKSLQPACDNLMAQLKGSGKRILTFGMTKGGDPRHPLTLGYDIDIVEIFP